MLYRFWNFMHRYWKLFLISAVPALVLLCPILFSGGGESFWNALGIVLYYLLPAFAVGYGILTGICFRKTLTPCFILLGTVWMTTGWFYLILSLFLPSILFLFAAVSSLITRFICRKQPGRDGERDGLFCKAERED